MNALITLLKQKRPSQLPQTYEWFDRFIRQHVPNIQRDHAHNYWCVIGDNPKHSYTAHYDTVHRTFEDNEVFINGNMIYTDQGARGTPLGADDAAGIYIMLELIKLKHPGYYFFFADEECGGIGSALFDLPAPLDIMISLDRMGTSDVIISQCSGQGASEQFGSWLGKHIDMTISHEGVFTDSDNFIDDIKECVNISVGYDRQHTKHETLDLNHVHSLIPKLASIDYTSAPVTGVTTPTHPHAIKTLEDYVYDNPELVAAFLVTIGVDEYEIEWTMKCQTSDFF